MMYFAADAVGSVLWATATLLLCAGGYRCAILLFPAERASFVIFVSLICVLAKITALGTALGMLGLVSPMIFLGSAAAIGASCVCFTFAFGPRAGKAQDKRKGDLGALFFSTTFAAAVIAQAAYVCGNHFPAEFDAVTYHLPMVVTWLQTHTMCGSQGSWWWWMPGNAEVIALWCACAVSGDFLTWLSNVPFVILCFLATTEAGVHLRLPRQYMLLLPPGALALHTMTFEMGEVLNDVAVLGYFLASLTFVIRCIRSSRLADFVLLGTCLGLLAGTKYFAIGYAAVLISPLPILFLVRRHPPSRFAIAAAAVSFAMFSGAWYLRNSVLGGSPLYPLGSATGISHPGGIWATTIAGNRSSELPSLIFRAVLLKAGPIHAACIAALPLCIWSNSRKVLTSRRIEGVLSSVVLTWITVGALSVWMLTPYAVEDIPNTLNHARWGYTPIRYGASALVSVVLLSAHTASHCLKGFPRLRDRCGEWVLCAGIALIAYQWSRFITLPFIGTGAFLAILVVAVAILYTHSAYWRRIAWISALAISAVGIVWIYSSHRSEAWHQGFDRYHSKAVGPQIASEVKILLDQHPGSLAVLDNRSYSFCGASRRQRVVSRLEFTGTEFSEFVSANRVSIVIVPTGADRKMNWRLERAIEAVDCNQDIFANVIELRSWRVCVVREPR